MILADVHIHTTHSHGSASTAEMFHSAVCQGLTIIGFSEHSPRPRGYSYPIDYQLTLCASFPAYIQEVSTLKENNSNVEVLLGVEIDYIPGQEEYANQLCHMYEYDYCIGGLHFQRTWGFDWSAEEWSILSKEEKFSAYTTYYYDLIQMCETQLFHIAAHPDLIKIFTNETFKEWIEKPETVDLITKAITAMRDNGVAMEVSSAGLRKACKEIYPCPLIMSIAKQVGVSISFASDAHCTKTPAYAFSSLQEYTSSFGFCESVIFRKKSPFFIPFK